MVFFEKPGQLCDYRQTPSVHIFHLVSDLCLSELKIHLKIFLCVILNCINMNTN